MFATTPLARKFSEIIFVFACVILISFALPKPAAAQFAASASLAVEPAFPAPLTNVSVSLEAYTMNTVGATITWFVNGTEMKASRNARTISVTTGALGEKMAVNATIAMPNGIPFTVKTVITPAVVDLILESDTYIPAFYRGRALPSGESTIHAVAIPQVGKSVSPSSLTYKWEYSGSVLLGGPVRGKQSIDITMSRFSDNYLTVTVMDQAGQAIAQKSLLLNPTDPELHFYEDNPLRGLHERAIDDGFMLIGDETTIYGEPYFMHTDLSQRSVGFTWSVNGEKTSFQNQDPHTITLRRSGGRGSADVELKALTTETIPQYLRRAFSITF